MGPRDLRNNTRYWIVQEMTLDFTEKIPSWAEEITVECWFSEISKLRIYIDFTVSCKQHICAKGYTLWLIIDSQTKKPIKTDEMLEKFSVYTDWTLGTHQKWVPPKLTQQYMTVNKIMDQTDIDFNGHVNNKRYLQLAFRSFDSEFADTHTLMHLNVRFKQETYQGDVLSCTSYYTYLPNHFMQLVQKNTIPVCEIATIWRE